MILEVIVISKFGQFINFYDKLKNARLYFKAHVKGAKISTKLFNRPTGIVTFCRHILINTHNELLGVKEKLLTKKNVFLNLSFNKYIIGF